jgi:hypothetical protein
MAYNVTYSIRGEAATDVSKMSVNIIGTETHADAVIAAQLLWELIEPICDGGLTGITLSESIEFPDGARTVPLDTARTKAGMKFSFRTDENHPTYVRVPTRKESMIADGTENVDISVGNTAMTAFLAAMTSGLDLTGDGGTGTTVFTDTRDEPIDSLYSAVEDFKS